MVPIEVGKGGWGGGLAVEVGVGVLWRCVLNLMGREVVDKAWRRKP